MAESTTFQHNCAPVGCSICKITQLEAEVKRLRLQVNWNVERCDDLTTRLERAEQAEEAWRLHAERAEAELTNLKASVPPMIDGMREGMEERQEWKERARNAEAEVERLRGALVDRADALATAYREERALADELAEALREIRRDNEPFMYAATDDALARWEEARGEV